jgi:hypothetical protein
MADGGSQETVTAAAWFAPFVGMVSAALGAAGVWLASRVMGKAAFQQAINAGFMGLNERLAEESARRDAGHAEERIRWAAQRAQFEGEIINLTQAVESLKAHLRRAGLAIPEDHSPPTGQMLILKGDDQA